MTMMNSPGGNRELEFQNRLLAVVSEVGRHTRIGLTANQTLEPPVSRGLAANLLHPFPADVLRAALHPACVADLPVGPGLVLGILVLAGQTARADRADAPLGP